MKTLKSICLSALLGAGVVLSAAGQGPAANINPALLYYQAFLVAPDPMSDADMDYLFSKEGRSQKLPERFGTLAARYDSQFSLVRQAARATVPCDWGINVSAGPATLLPHLARAKAVAVTVPFRVTWDLQHGRQADAREDLVATVVLARNVARDGTLISTLVQHALQAIAFCTVADRFGQFTPETLQQVLDGIDAAPAPATVASCVATEKAFLQDWLVDKIVELQQANPNADAKVMAAIHDMLTNMLGSPQDLPRMTLTANSDQTNWWAQLSLAAGGSSEGVVKLIRELEPVSQRLALILASPYGQYESQMAQFKAEVERSANPLAPVLFPAWERARPRELRIQVYLAMVRAAIEYKLHGEAGFHNVTDPCGQGPFALQRFFFEGVDRGIQLKSAYIYSGTPLTLIFVEKSGPPFRVDGPNVGQAITK